MIRKEAWPFYRTTSGVRLCWELEEPKGPKKAPFKAPVSPSTLLTSVHWGKPLHVFGLTSEVSVVGAHMSLTMGYHYGPLADLLVLVCVRHEPPGPSSHPFEDYPLSGSAAILCTGGPDVIRKKAWSFYKTSSGVRLCWELEEPKGPKAPPFGILLPPWYPRLKLLCPNHGIL